MKKVFRILITLLILSLILLLNSCDIYKKASKTKTNLDLTEQIEIKTSRKGDTVRYEVPKITLKDTTIYTYNKQGTTLKTYFDKSGSVGSIDCFSSLIDEYRKENRILIESTKQKDSEKKEELNTTWILYGFIMIGVALIVFMILFFLYVKAQSASFKTILEKTSSK